MFSTCVLIMAKKGIEIYTTCLLSFQGYGIKDKLSETPSSELKVLDGEFGADPQLAER